MTYGNQLREFNVLADLAMQRTSVAVNGWNISNKAAMQFEATDSAISSELNGDTSGVSILQSALGQRKEALAHTVPLNDQEAQHEAEAFFRMRPALCGRTRRCGDKQVTPRRLAARFAGTWTTL
jgi:hypothetical protein